MVNNISALRHILKLVIVIWHNLYAAITCTRHTTIGTDKVTTHRNIPIGTLTPFAIGRAITKGTCAHGFTLF